LLEPFEDLPLPDDPARGGGDDPFEELGRDGGLDVRGADEPGEGRVARGGGDEPRGELVVGGADLGEPVAGGV